MAQTCATCGMDWDDVEILRTREIINAHEKSEPAESSRGDGGSTSYYELPSGATELRHLIRHKKMTHAIGEAFCALYRLHDNGEYERNLKKAIFYLQCELDEHGMF